jgi:hypothetical protein
MTEDRTGPDAPRHARAVTEALATVRESLDRLKFGAIVLTVHDGRLVQLEVTEKLRFSA